MLERLLDERELELLLDARELLDELDDRELLDELLERELLDELGDRELLELLLDRELLDELDDRELLELLLDRELLDELDEGPVRELLDELVGVGPDDAAPVVRLVPPLMPSAFSSDGDVGVPPPHPIRAPLAVRSVAPPDSRMRKSRRLDGVDRGWPCVVEFGSFFTVTSPLARSEHRGVSTLSDVSQERQGSSVEIERDPPNHLLGRDHVHAPRQ